MSKLRTCESTEFWIEFTFNNKESPETMEKEVSDRTQGLIEAGFNLDYSSEIWHSGGVERTVIEQVWVKTKEFDEEEI